MKCNNCGMEVKENETFCGNCGNKIVPDNNENNINTNTNNDTPVYNNTVVYNNVTIYNNKKSMIIWILLLISIIGCMGACFLPYASGFGQTINYVYEGETILDGIFVLVFGAIAILLLLFKKRIPVLVFQILSLVVFIVDLANAKPEYISYGIGFYLVLILIIASIVLAAIRLFLKNKFE